MKEEKKNGEIERWLEKQAMKEMVVKTGTAFIFSLINRKRKTRGDHTFTTLLEYIMCLLLDYCIRIADFL